VLGDIVEALIAAVFIDSGRQLAAAWRALDHLTSFKTMFERDVFAQHLESERREAEQRRELEREERASTAARKAKSKRGRSDAAAAADVAAHAAEAAAAADASAVAASSAGTAASAAAAAAAAAATQGEGAASAALLLPPPLGAQLDAFDASLAGLEDPALDDEAARGVEFGTFDAAF
jgi:dsRNA-specific ribonuclease